jgi:hypothetical protein
MGVAKHTLIVNGHCPQCNQTRRLQSAPYIPWYSWLCAGLLALSIYGLVICWLPLFVKASAQRCQTCGHRFTYK